MQMSVIRRPRLLSFVLVALLATACSDPETAKQRFLERGEALAAKGEHRDAILEYRNALKVDPRFGEARLQLADSLGATDRHENAVREYVRAAELLPDRADVQARVAGIYLASGQYELARKHAEKAVELEPGNTTGQLLLANSLAGLKDLAGAVREIEEAIELAPTDSRPHTSLGMLRMAEGNRQAALAAYKRAVDVDANSIEAKLALAHYYWNAGSPAEAERTLKDALAIDESHPLGNRMMSLFYLTSNRAAEAEPPLLRLVAQDDGPAMLTLGDVYLRTNREPEARELYARASAVRATRGPAVSRLAQIDFGRGNRDAAYARIDDVLGAEPNNPELLVLKAGFLLRDKRVAEAEELARKAVAAQPTAAAHFALGAVQQAGEKFDDAIASYNEVLRLNPRAATAEIQLSRLMLMRGKPEEALRHAATVKQAQPQNPDARFMTAAALLASRDFAKAEPEIRALLRDHPRVGKVHELHGGLLAARSDTAGAVRAFDRALELDASSVSALRGRVTLDIQQKRPADARARITQAVAAAPDNGRLLVLAGSVESATGDHAAAERYLRRALELAPDSIDAYRALARVYLRQRKLDEARVEFEQIAGRAQDPVPAKTMVGIIYDVQNRPDDAIKMYEEIVAGTSRAPVAANNLAWRYAERGQNLDQALQLAQSAKAQMPDSPEVDDTLGWVYYQKNMADLAIPAFESSVKRAPENASYHLHLGLAYAKAGRKQDAIRALERTLSLAPTGAGADEARSALASLKG